MAEYVQVLTTIDNEVQADELGRGIAAETGRARGVV